MVTSGVMYSSHGNVWCYVLEQWLRLELCTRAMVTSGVTYSSNVTPGVMYSSNGNVWSYVLEQCYAWSYVLESWLRLELCTRLSYETIRCIRCFMANTSEIRDVSRTMDYFLKQN
ncbi:hypothetical protein DPMN_189662 [Dreissena polymorpha]|uniref:Uncharacterized protein n=1 Tax=Dreissena polymorpha TaxID=45954 RepID=A0A9D4DUH2_DREPO|nr:hypothetical protein DPMN_189662 [Dreissena polymorpha]